MDNQAIQKSFGAKKLIAIIIATALTFLVCILGLFSQFSPDPYISEVLTIKGSIANGSDIFQINCSGCHASKIGGSVGPNLSNIGKRKSKQEIIKQVISGRTPPMPKFQPSSSEMSDLLSYLETLN